MVSRTKYSEIYTVMDNGKPPNRSYSGILADADLWSSTVCHFGQKHFHANGKQPKSIKKAKITLINQSRGAVLIFYLKHQSRKLHKFINYNFVKFPTDRWQITSQDPNLGMWHCSTEASVIRHWQKFRYPTRAPVSVRLPVWSTWWKWLSRHVHL